jgi:hypothetical protein
MALRLRRGTNAERLTITPEIGELIYTTDTKKVFVGDGSTAGGVPIDTGLLDLAGNSLNDLGDVATTAPTDTQVLAWNDANSNWEPADAATPDLSASVISDLSDVGIGVINNEQVLIWNESASQFQPGDVLGLTTELTDIANVADQDPTDTQVLAWSASQASWVPADAATPDLTSAVISDLSDVSIAVINSGQILVWDGTHFVPGDVNADVVSDTSPVLGGALDAGGFNITNAGSISAININATNFTGNFIGTHSGDFNGDFDGNFVGSIYNEDSALVFDAENNTVSNLVSVTATEFEGDLTGDVTGNVTGNVTGSITGDVQGSVFADNSTLLVDGINSEVFGTIKGTIDTGETINITLDQTLDSNDGLVLNMHRGTEDVKLEPNNFDRSFVKWAAWNGSAFADTALIGGYHKTGGGGYLAITPTEADGTPFTTAIELDGVDGTIVINTTDKVTSNAPIESTKYLRVGSYATEALPGTAAGTIAFDSTTNTFKGYNGTSWVELG